MVVCTQAVSRSHARARAMGNYNCVTTRATFGFISGARTGSTCIDTVVVRWVTVLTVVYTSK